MSRDIRLILRKVSHGVRLTEQEAVCLFKARRRALHDVLQAADDLRAKRVGNLVTYVVNKNVNWTNVCTNGCLFCGFFRLPGHPDAYCLSVQEIIDQIKNSLVHKISEVCLVAGLHPNKTWNDYLQLVTAVKEAFPEIHIHGMTPEELKHALRGTGLSYREGYRILKACGLGSVAGTAAEILVDRVRAAICPNKLSTEQWVQAIQAAHQVGLRATATIMYGHVERIEDRVKHLSILRSLQDKTGVFTEFVPLSFVHYDTPLFSRGIVTGGASAIEDVLMIAVSRLFLDNIPNIQASWVKYGEKLAQFMLTTGANDLGGTLYGESITRAAGGRNKPYLTVNELRELANSIGRDAQERSTLYDWIIR